MKKLTTHRSTGNDGYNPGTWEWRIGDDKGNMSFDGGWPDEETARKQGEKMLRQMLDEKGDDEEGWDLDDA